MVLFLGIHLIQSHENKLFEECFLSLRSFYMPQIIQNEFFVQAILHYSIDCLAVLFAFCYLGYSQHDWKSVVPLCFNKHCCDNVQISKEQFSSTAALLNHLRKTKSQFYNEKQHFSLSLTDFLKVAPDSTADRCTEFLLKYEMIDWHAQCYAIEKNDEQPAAAIKEIN